MIFVNIFFFHIYLFRTNQRMPIGRFLPHGKGRGGEDRKNAGKRIHFRPVLVYRLERKEVKLMFGSDHVCAGFWWVCPIFIFIMIIVCFFMMRGCSRMFNRRDRRDVADESALDILNARYVKGEIGREEYERMKREIREQ
jgi:uncharacterized membrane protein